MSEEKGVNLEQVKEEAEKLLILFNDSPSGLMGWNGFVGEKLKVLHDLTSPAFGCECEKAKNNE